MRVESFLAGTAERVPNKVALVCDDQRITYRALDAESDRLARLFTAYGVQRGDRIAIYLENSVEAVISIFAALKAGGTFTLINSTTKPEKLRFLLNDSRAVAIVCQGRQLVALDQVAGPTPHLKLIVGQRRGDGRSPHVEKTFVSFTEEPRPGTVAPEPGIDIDLAALIYTSGSSGVPKAVMLSHINIVSAATSIIGYLEMRESDVIMNVLPLSFDYGLYQVLMGFAVGATVVLERSFTYTHAVLQTLCREQVTGFPIVPTLSAILLDIDLSRYDFSSLRYITSTGAALPEAHLVELRRRFPGVRIYSMYGLTECKRVSYLPPEEIDRRPTSVGRGMPNEEVYIVDEQDNRLESGVGELVVRGSNVMEGYWERPEDTTRALRPGVLPGERVLYTGDLFRRDEEGFLYFVGRKDDIIKTRAEKVSPKEIENVLCSIDGVAEAAVFGLPDRILGEAVTALVTLRAGATLSEADIMRECARHVEDFMVPQTVAIMESFPKSPNGKVARSELKRMLQARHAAVV